MEALLDYLMLLKKHDKEDNTIIRMVSDYILELLFNLYEDDNKLFQDVSSWNNFKGFQAKCSLFPISPWCVAMIPGVQKIFNNPIIQEKLCDKQFYSRHKIETPNRVHHEICKEIFKEIEQVDNFKNSFWIQIDHDDSYRQESTSEQINSFESTDYIRLAILSEDARRYDHLVFSLLREDNERIRQIVRESYRPYFIEFYVDARDLKHRQRNFFSNADNYGTWFRACFAPREGVVGETDMVFEGVYSSSASPVKYKRKKLVIDDRRIEKEIIDKINKTYSLKVGCCSDDKEIKKELNGIFDNVIFNKVRIFKVGNGNCVYSYGKVGKKEKRLLYDIGFDNNTAVNEKIQKMPYSYQPSINRIRQFLPDCVILSHWDADHYKACAYCRKELFECKWIAPDYKDASSNAKRLGKYLYLIKKLMFVDRSVSRAIEIDLSKNSRLTLYMGEYTKKHTEQLSKPNCQGIAVKHENGLHQNNKIRCLMQGDVSYISLPTQACFARENPYDYLIAPHHGSEMDYSLLLGKKYKDGYAVICCSNNTTKVKNRPADKHLQALQKCYREVEVTEDAKTYIQFNLGAKNSVRKV